MKSKTELFTEIAAKSNDEEWNLPLFHVNYYIDEEASKNYKAPLIIKSVDKGHEGKSETEPFFEIYINEYAKYFCTTAMLNKVGKIANELIKDLKDKGLLPEEMIEAIIGYSVKYYRDKFFFVISSKEKGDEIASLKSFEKLTALSNKNVDFITASFQQFLRMQMKGELLPEPIPVSLLYKRNYKKDWILDKSEIPATTHNQLPFDKAEKDNLMIELNQLSSDKNMAIVQLKTDGFSIVSLQVHGI